jgi:hypothetical protein
MDVELIFKSVLATDVQKLVAKYIGVNTSEFHLYEPLGGFLNAQELSMEDLLQQIGKRYFISFNESDVKEVKCVIDIISLLEQKVPK